MITDKKISKSNTEFIPLPSDMYQVQIVDVVEKEGIKYASTEKVMQFMFRCEVVEGEQKARLLFFFTSESWFDGGKSSKPSKLYNLIKTIYSYYKKNVDVSTIEEITDAEINGLVGTQLRVTVEATDAGKNKVTGFLPIKKEVKYEVKNESVSVDPDLPFP